MIGKDESPWRQYRLPGGLEVRRIHFYSKDRVVYTSRHSYLQDDGEDVDAIDIPTPAKANKVNLRRTDCFFVLCKDDPFGRLMADLYIPTQIATISILPEEGLVETANNYAHAYFHPVTIELGAIARKYTGEKDHRGDPIRKEVRIEKIHERTSFRWELTHEGRKAKELQDQMKGLRIDIDFGTLLDLIKFYDVKPK